MTDHRTAWLDRYGSCYTTDAERTAGYREHQAVLAEMRSVFRDTAETTTDTTDKDDDR
jgi:hypothetical protein